MNIFPNQGVMYTLEGKFNKYSEDKALSSLQKYRKSYPLWSVTKGIGVILVFFRVNCDLGHRDIC